MAAISLANHLVADSADAANLQMSGKTRTEVRALLSLVDTFLVPVEARAVHYMHAATAVGILGADHGHLDIRTISTHPVAATVGGKDPNYQPGDQKSFHQQSHH